MKILYDYDIFARQQFGGISKYFYELISGFNNYNDIKVDLFLGLNNSGYDFEKLNNISLTGKNFSYADKLHFLLYSFNKRSFNKYIKENSFNLFHKTYYSDAGLDSKGVKISTIHDMTNELYPKFFAKSDNTSDLKKDCINASRGLICVSHTTKNDLLNLYNLDNKQIRVIYHGIRKLNQIKFEKYIDSPYLLYVGQRWGYKNFNLLLSAYNKHSLFKNNFKLVCFGGGKFNISEKVFLNENKLNDKVIHTGGNDSVLNSYYKYADAFVYPSYYEGFGFPPLEAMNCGCPVFASSAGSVSEIVGDAALLFNPSDLDEMISKLEMLLESTDLRKNLIEKGMERVKMFSWETCVKEHYKFYNELIN